MSKKLLLADDSVTIQKVIEITFANEDYDLTIVGNGDAALEKARLNPPDLVLADIIMPGINGYELCSEIKKIPELAQTPVLLLAGSFEPFDEDKARSVGADSWIAKPFESQALIEKVKGLLESPPQPIQMPTSPVVPSLDEKEASLEDIIPLESAAPREVASSWEEKPADEFSSEQVASKDESFNTQEAEFISGPVFDEPEESVVMETGSEITDSSADEPDVPFEVEAEAETEESFVSFEADSTASTPSPAEESVPAEPPQFELEKPFEIEAEAESEESFVGFEADSTASTPSPVEESVPAEPPQFELEEPFEIEAEAESEESFVGFESDSTTSIPSPVEESGSAESPLVEFEEPFEAKTELGPDESLAAVETDADVGSSVFMAPASEEEEFLPLEGQEDDEEEILLLDENDIVTEEEPADEEDFAVDSEVFAEEAVPAREEFFENLPESSFDFEPEEEEPPLEEKTGIVLHRPLGSFSLDEVDEESSSAEEEQLSDAPVMSEVPEEAEADREFSFDDFDEGLPEESEISAEPEELFSSVPEESAADLKPPAPSYAQMEQKVHSLTDAQLYAIVEKVAGATIERMARGILEEVAWEVVPNLSENIIKEEIQKIKAAQ